MAKKVKLPVMFSPRGIAAYAWINRPDDQFNKDKPSYKVTLVVDQGEETDAWLAEIEEIGRKVAADMGFKSISKKKNLKLPFETGEEFNARLEDKEREPKEEFSGKVLISFKSAYAPTVLIPTSLPSDTIVMSGDIIKVKFKVNAYDGFGGGISLRLAGIKLLEKIAGDENDWGDDDDEEYTPSTASTKPSAPADDDDEDDDDGSDY